MMHGKGGERKIAILAEKYFHTGYAKTALGVIKYDPGKYVFYGRPYPSNFDARKGFHGAVNGRATDAALAEWCWSLGKPRVYGTDYETDPADPYDYGIFDSPRLENLWYCPYYMHQRESARFEKK